MYPSFFRRYMKKNKKMLTIFMIISFIIIILESLNSFFVVKSIEIFNEFQKVNNVDFNTYLNLQLLNYFSSVVLYIIFSIYNYFLWDKLKMDILYKGIFGIFITANVLFKIFVYAHSTIFYILSIIMQIILLILIISYKERTGLYE